MLIREEDFHIETPSRYDQSCASILSGLSSSHQIQKNNIISLEYQINWEEPNNEFLNQITYWALFFVSNVRK